MELQTIAALLLSGLIGVSLGLMGGGGSILAMPVLVYVAGIETKEAVAMSLAIVGSTSLVGSLLHGCRGQLNLMVAVTVGGAGIIGAFFGARFTRFVSAHTLLLLFAALMLISAVMMLTRKDHLGLDDREQHGRNLVWMLLAGLGVGVLTGFLGVGGGFLVVPVLVFVAGLPMRQAVGTSLLVIAINAAAGFLGHLSEGHLHLRPTLAFTSAAVVGALAGERFARHLPALRLRQVFSYTVILIAIMLVIAN
jgi:uncharacterized protein